MMTVQRHSQSISVIVVLGLVCSGCVDTGTDSGTPLEKAIQKQQNIENLTYIETLTLNIGNETRAIEYDVILQKPNKFRRIEKSGPYICSEIVSNGDVVWIYDPEENTVLIRNLTSSEKTPEPAIYALLVDNITKNYMVEEMESLNSTSAYKVKLTPHELDSEDTREYLLWIDSMSMVPLKLQSYDKGNLVLTLEYRNYSMNCVINDDEFTFTIPDGASVVYA
ncbi:MAG: LolA family protein [Methanoculleus sp.]|jgi:outer membrane lipoprotein-sorting protein